MKVTDARKEIERLEDMNREMFNTQVSDQRMIPEVYEAMTSSIVEKQKKLMQEIAMGESMMVARYGNVTARQLVFPFYWQTTIGLEECPF